ILMLLALIFILYFFFFSSRRRHTRSKRDWSSDVCSSDLRRAVQNSIGYMLLVRCGLDPSEYFEDEDFRDVLNFNTPQTLNALGEIGRASCRERVERWVGAGDVRGRKKERE